MYAVIFKAEINSPDDKYYQCAKRMRKLALGKYGCRDFVSITESNFEVSISYWDSEQHILEWKHDREHLEAQQLAKSRWYKSYQVEVVEIIRKYEKE